MLKDHRKIFQHFPQHWKSLENLEKCSEGAGTFLKIPVIRWKSQEFDTEKVGRYKDHLGYNLSLRSLFWKNVPSRVFFMYQKTTTILPLQMNHTAPIQILQYHNSKSVSTISSHCKYHLQWLGNKDPLDPKPNNILKKKGPCRNLKLMETLKNCKL